MNQRLVDKPVTVIDRDSVTVFKLNLPFLVTGVGRVVEQGDAFLQWEYARHKEAVGPTFTKNQE